MCCETFTNTAAGDAHRVGGWAEEPYRRCLTPDEMRNRPKRPLEQNERGYWTFAERIGRAPQWLTGLTETAEQDEDG